MAPVTLGTPTLETPRLILRPWREDDAAALFLHAKDPSVGPMAGWPPHTSVADSRRIIRDVLAVPETYAIVLKRFSEVDHPIGSIGLMVGGASSLGIADDEAEIGYWVGRIHWGHGYMPEAVREVMRHAFEDLGLSRIWCGYDEGNDKSRRVQEKVGLVPHHVIPDRERRLMGDVKTEYVTSISREGWRLAQSADPSDRATERAQREETADLIENIPLVARIRSGAQTGADRAGLDAARAAGIAICGWCPKGGLAEDMPEAPGVLVRYPELKESPSLGYIQRTAWNVRDSHATLVVSPDGVEPGGGTEATVRLAHAYGRPVLVVTSSSEVRKAVDWAHGLGRGITLNVAGPRSSKSPTVYDMTREVVAAILAQDALLPAPRSPLPEKGYNPPKRRTTTMEAPHELLPREGHEDDHLHHVRRGG
jgi:RimJ/RimL family protein N-acetyltransferase